MFIRLYNLYLYKNKAELPKLNSTFINASIRVLGTRDNRGKRPAKNDIYVKLEDFYEKEYKSIYVHKKHDMSGLSFIIPYLSQTMETCIINNLKEHFVKRLFRFINIVAGKYYDNESDKIDDDKEYTKKKKHTLFLLKQHILDVSKEEPKIFEKWLLEYKDKIVPSEFKKSIPYDCKANPSKYLKYALFMNSIFEKENAKIDKKIKNIKSSTDAETKKLVKKLNSEKIKLFQPLSLRNSCIPKYVTFDTAAIANMFSEKGEKGKLLQTISKNKETIWEKCLKINKKLFHPNSEYVFNFTIQTDGVGCSLLFCHKSIASKKYGQNIEKVEKDFVYLDDLTEYQLENLQKKKLVSVDPGKLYLAYMADDEGNKLKYSCRQRDTESLAKRNRRIIQTNKQKSKIIEEETKLSNCCCKTSDFNKFKKFIKEKHKINLRIRSKYENMLYRKLCWRTKTYRQRSEDKFINKIEETFGPKEDLIILWGDWSRSTQMAGLTPTMGTGLRKIVAKKYITLLINEYNTSKKCCNCWSNIENVKINENTKFRLLVCKNCKGKNTGSSESENKSVFNSSNSFLTRDLNSCINMLSIAKHMIYRDKERPKEFCPLSRRGKVATRINSSASKLPSPSINVKRRKEKVGI
jgi:hypothetical protein